MAERGTSASRARARWRERLAAFARRRVPWPRVARWGLVASAVVLVSAAWGVATATAEASLGPHEARYEVTVDGEVTVDLGPLGTLVIDSPAPAGIGVRVVVKEIPRGVDAFGDVDTLEALADDLERYVQFFSAPEATITVAVRALVADAVTRTLVMATALGVVLVGGRWLLGPARRAELAAGVRAHRTVVAAVAALVVVVPTTVTASTDRALERGPTAAASRVFDGTPLEGARITGRLAGVIDTYGGYVVDAYRENEEFYTGVQENLLAAWEERTLAEERAAAAREARRATAPGAQDTDGQGPNSGADAAERGPEGDDAPAQDPDGDPVDDVAGTGDGGDLEGGPTGGATDGPSGGSTARPGAGPSGDPRDEAEPDLVTLLLVSDLHCNVGMARVIRTAAELAEADVVLNAGDTTVNGTAVESYCVEELVGATAGALPTVVADGNHDSTQTAAQERAAGALVLAGDVVEVAGVRVAGDADPRATRIGAGTRLVGDETPEDMAERLSDVACAGDADLLLVHDPRIALRSLERGCVGTTLSGHMHARHGPERYGAGVRYTSASTAGAALDQPTVGPLNGTAELTVLRFDRERRRVVDHRLVRVAPDGSVSVGGWLAWPDPSQDGSVHAPERGTTVQDPV